jgi:hypothetical protein
MGSLTGIEWVSKRDYCEAEDIPRAEQRARTIAEAMLNGWIDPLAWREEIELALEVLCDGPGGDPSLALEAIKAVEHRFLRPAAGESESRLHNAARFACGATMIAEVAHRNGRCPEAVLYTSSALDRLETAAGGRDALLKLIASPQGHPLARASTAVYAIRVAALRRADYLPAHKDFLRARSEGVVAAYLASGRIDPRSHAFATQVLFEQVELGNMEHLDLLLSISSETRSSTKRAWTTEPLVQMEYRRALGDIEGAKLAAKLAAERIRDFGLVRHLEVIAQYRYLAFD